VSDHYVIVNVEVTRREDVVKKSMTLSGNADEGTTKNNMK